MSHLIQIKQRIKAIEKTKKITRAMRLIAMSLYSRLEKQKDALSHYKKVVNSLKPLLQKNNEFIPDAFNPEDVTDSSPLFILCASTKSLCGGMNSNIIKYFKTKFLIEAGQQPFFIAVGNRALSLLQQMNYTERVIHFEKDLSMATVEATANTIINLVVENKTQFSSVTIYSTRLKNFFIQEPSHQTIIPLQSDPEEVDITAETATQFENLEGYIWEQPLKTLCTTISRHYVYTELVEALFHNIISENAARFVAMDQSTNNADKYLETLSLTYNKSRQSEITREIAELASNLDDR